MKKLVLWRSLVGHSLFSLLHYASAARVDRREINLRRRESPVSEKGIC